MPGGSNEKNLKAGLVNTTISPGMPRGQCHTDDRCMGTGRGGSSKIGN